MLEEGTVSVLFSFTRSYFHVDLAHVGEAVSSSIDPAAQAGERAVHGARPRQAGQDRALRELFRHLQTSDDQFMLAPVKRGW